MTISRRSTAALTGFVALVIGTSTYVGAQSIDDMLKGIEQKTAQQKAAEAKRRQEANRLFQKAEALFREGRYARAQSLYGEVRGSGVDLGKQTANTITVRLREIGRKTAAEREATFAKYEKACSLYKGGKLAEAKKLLVDVRESGVDLGWWKGRALQRQLADIDARLKKPVRPVSDPKAALAKKRAKEQEKKLAEAGQLLNARKYAEAKRLLAELERTPSALPQEKRRLVAQYLRQT